MGKRAKLKRARRQEQRSRAAGAALSPSTRAARAASPSREPPAADGFGLLESLDGHAALRNAIGRLAGRISEYAGVPMPLDVEELVVEPSYAFAKHLGRKKETDLSPGFKVRNTFHSSKRGCEIHVVEMADGRIDWTYTPAVHHFAYDLKTLGCSDAWGIEQEHNALQLLGTLVGHRAFKQYLLTGMFLETSRRSGVTYVFRKLRPTVAIKEVRGEMKILAALCMHPIAYYAGSWAGAMCPTDDVVAHLQLMRGDEPMLWRRANQHAAWRPEAGL